jgi:predicted secreted protein
MKKQLVTVVIVVLLTGIALSGCVNESKKTMTYTKLMSDIKPLPPTDLITLQSYKDGEVIYIEDTVYNISYFERSESEKYTLVAFGNSTSLIGFPICINGDKRSEYPAGSTVSIPVHVKNYVLNGTAVTWLEEWYTFYNLINENAGTKEPVKLTSEDNGSNAQLSVGDTVNLTLKDYGDGGYLWYIVELDEHILNLTQSFSWGATAGMLGDFGYDTWIFTAKNIGTTTLKLASYRPSEGIENATTNFTAYIEVV